MVLHTCSHVCAGKCSNECSPDSYHYSCHSCIRENLIKERKKMKRIMQPLFFNPPYNNIVAWNPMRSHSLEEPAWTTEDDKIIERKFKEQLEMSEYVNKLLDRRVRWNEM